MYYNTETEWPISCDEPVLYRHDGDTDSERETLCPFYRLNMERNVYEEYSNIWVN